MKSLCAAILACSLISGFAADPNPAADSEWAEILKNSKPPTPPAEWNQKAPTPEQMAEFKKKVGAAAEVSLGLLLESSPHATASIATAATMASRASRVLVFIGSLPFVCSEPA